MEAFWLLVLMVLTTTATTIADEFETRKLGQCYAGCADEFLKSADVARTLLSGKTIFERNDTADKYQLCKLGCNGVPFGSMLAGIKTGVDLSRRILRNSPVQAGIVNKLRLVCADPGSYSTRIHLAVDVNETSAASTVHVCALDVYNNGTKVTNTTYSLKTHFHIAVTLLPKAQYKFQVRCFNRDGQLGKEVTSESREGKRLLPNPGLVDFAIMKMDYFNQSLTAKFEWREPERSDSVLPQCRQRLLLTTDKANERIITLDESNEILVEGLPFSTSYLTTLLPESMPATRKMNSPSVTFKTKSCEEVVEVATVCAPPPAAPVPQVINDNVSKCGNSSFSCVTFLWINIAILCCCIVMLLAMAAAAGLYIILKWIPSRAKVHDGERDIESGSISLFTPMYFPVVSTPDCSTDSGNKTAYFNGRPISVPRIGTYI